MQRRTRSDRSRSEPEPPRRMEAQRRAPRRVRALGALALALGLGCVAGPFPSVRFMRTDREPTSDGLRRVWSSRFGRVYLMPEARFSVYESLVVDPIRVSYKSPPAAEPSMHQTRGNFALSESNRLRFTQLFQELLERKLAEVEGLALAPEPGPRTLRVTGWILNLVMGVAPSAGGDVHFVRDAGEMTLVVDIRDAQTGEPLARLMDRRKIRLKTRSYFNADLNRWTALREIFADWSWFVAATLGDLRRLPSVPTVADTRTRPVEGAETDSPPGQ